MKCSNCGKEFGNGANCQFCGIDRVTGLGNYGGYNAPVSDSSHINSLNKGDSMICYNCNEVIPADSKFCPYCSKKLYVTCPKCGKTYSSQFPACNKCGTNRGIYYKKVEAEKQKAVENQSKQEEFKKYLKNLDELAQEADRSPAKESPKEIHLVYNWEKKEWEEVINI